MRNLQTRITRLEKGTSNLTNDIFYSFVCMFHDSQGKPLPQKQDDIALTLKQLGQALPL